MGCSHSLVRLQRGLLLASSGRNGGQPTYAAVGSLPRLDEATVGRLREGRVPREIRTGHPSTAGARDSAVGPDQPHSDRVANKARDVVDTQALHHRDAMRLGGLEAETQLIRYLARLESLDHEEQHFELPR